MSEFPTNFLKYLSALTRQCSQKNGKVKHRLTQSSAFYFLRRDPKDSEDLDHNIYTNVRHSLSRCNASVKLKSLEKSFDAVEEVDELVSASAGIFSCLRVKGIKISRAR